MGKLIKEFGSEFDVLLKADLEELQKTTKEEIAKAIIQNRKEEYDVNPGYDGVYGDPVFNFEDSGKVKETHKTDQSTLDQY